MVNPRVVVTKVIPMLLSLLLAVVWPAVAPVTARADDDGFEQVDTPRFILRLDKKGLQSATQTSSIPLLSEQAIRILDEAAEEVQSRFGVRPESRVVLRFLSPENFKREVNAPNWTTGMFYHGEIIIPVSQSSPLDDEELRRTLRHEYVHAVVAEISDFHCPAWLDEGLAQLVEGKPAAPLRAALQRWQKARALLPLKDLEKGFTTLPDNMVPVAYAQSFYAARRLAEDKGFAAIATFLGLLRKGFSAEEAFPRAFKITLRGFQQGLAADMGK